MSHKTIVNIEAVETVKTEKATEPPKTIGMFGGKFLLVHKGHVHAMQRAAAMVDVLYIIVTYNLELEQNLYFSNSAITPISIEQRLRWWHQITKDMSNVVVHAVEETNVDNEPDWHSCADRIKATVAKPINIVFSSELSYDSIFNQLYPNAQHVVIDSQRQAYPISATQIRQEGAMRHWQQLPDVVRPYFAKSIVIVGTESTGKSTLAYKLAKHFETGWVEEVGRKFYEAIGAEIVLYEDFAQIAYEHKYRERQAQKMANKIFFVDTEALTTQYFSMAYLGKRQALLDEIAKLQSYDLWLFLEPDVAWVADGLRSFGDTEIRDQNNQLLKGLLDEFGIDYQSISCNYEERYSRAIDLVNELLDLPDISD